MAAQHFDIDLQANEIVFNNPKYTNVRYNVNKNNRVIAKNVFWGEEREK